MFSTKIFTGDDTQLTYHVYHQLNFRRHLPAIFLRYCPVRAAITLPQYLRTVGMPGGRLLQQR